MVIASDLLGGVGAVLTYLFFTWMWKDTHYFIGVVKVMRHLSCCGAIHQYLFCKCTKEETTYGVR